MKMGIESNVSDRKGKDFKSNTKKKRQKRVLAVQKLYETCQEVFADCGPGIVPSPENVERLKAVLDVMTECDVGLRQNMPFFKNMTNEIVPHIVYLHLYDCDKFSIGIFCLPPMSVIPLHNHPGMTVFSKLLFGTMHIKSYDWADKNAKKIAEKNAESVNQNLPLGEGEGECSEGVKLAKLKVDAEFTAPCDTSILYPSDGGNMHCFTAVTPCAVLDVLGPPYNDPEGRHCQYYTDFPFTSFKGLVDEVEDEESYAWLKERERPQDVIVVAAKYKGPKIVPK